MRRLPIAAQGRLYCINGPYLAAILDDSDPVWGLFLSILLAMAVLPRVANVRTDGMRHRAGTVVPPVLAFAAVSRAGRLACIEVSPAVVRAGQAHYEEARERSDLRVIEDGRFVIFDRRTPSCMPKPFCLMGI